MDTFIMYCLMVFKLLPYAQAQKIETSEILAEIVAMQRGAINTVTQSVPGQVKSLTFDWDVRKDLAQKLNADMFGKSEWTRQVGLNKGGFVRSCIEIQFEERQILMKDEFTGWIDSLLAGALFAIINGAQNELALSESVSGIAVSGITVTIEPRWFLSGSLFEELHLDGHAVLLRRRTNGTILEAARVNYTCSLAFQSRASVSLGMVPYNVAAPGYAVWVKDAGWQASLWSINIWYN
jgi:hypothetical protein